MPHYHFELHILLVKDGEQPIHMTKRVMDIYLTVIVQIAYNMAQSYIQKGWIIKQIETKNFIFLPDDSLTWCD
jgi:hypothetical protein